MKHWILSILAVLGLCSSCQSQDGITTLEPKQFAEAVKADSNAVLLDVRTPGEYADGHLEGAGNLDFRNAAAFDEGLMKLSKAPTYYVYCRSGRRSMAACKKMKADGFKVIDMTGGITAWKADGLPTVK